MLAIIVLVLRILLVIVLYCFLGWTIYTLWRDLKFQSQVLMTKKIPAISIYSDTDPSFEKLTFVKSEVSIGRDETCDLILPEETISSRHTRLNYRNAHWWVEDLLSTNGTFLNDERVETPTILISGDELRIGNNILVIDIQLID